MEYILQIATVPIDMNSEELESICDNVAKAEYRGARYVTVGVYDKVKRGVVMVRFDCIPKEHLGD